MIDGRISGGVPGRVGELTPGLGLPDLSGDEFDWQENALCAQTDPEAFFPDKGGSTRAAKSVCMACEVRVECLEYALEHDERFGVWGGMTERERRKVKRQRPKPLHTTWGAL